MSNRVGEKSLKALRKKFSDKWKEVTGFHKALYVVLQKKTGLLDLKKNWGY